MDAEVHNLLEIINFIGKSDRFSIDRHAQKAMTRLISFCKEYQDVIKKTFGVQLFNNQKQLKLLKTNHIYVLPRYDDNDRFYRLSSNTGRLHYLQARDVETISQKLINKLITVKSHNQIVQAKVVNNLA